LAFTFAFVMTHGVNQQIELLTDCANAATVLEKLAHSTGFEPVTSAFGGLMWP